MRRKWPLFILALTVLASLTFNADSMPSFDAIRAIICKDTDGTDCKPMLRVLAAMNSYGSNWAVKFGYTSTAVFAGPNDSLWGANSSDDITFHFTRTNGRHVYDLTFMGSYTTQTVVQYSGCIPGTYCCTSNTGMTRSFKVVPMPGAISYNVFDTSSPYFKWDFSINVTLGTNSSTIDLSESNNEGKWPENSISPIITGRVIPLSNSPNSGIDYTSSRMVIEPFWSREPFFVPADQFVPGRNRIAITQETFNYLAVGMCELDTLKRIVQVGADERDAFSQWYRRLVINPQYGYASIGRSKFNQGDPKNYLTTILLGDRATLLTEVMVDSTDYVLVPIHAEPVGTGGYGYIDNTTKHFHSFVDVTNAGRTAGHVTVKAGRCCYAPSNATQIQTLTCAYIFSVGYNSPMIRGSFLGPSESSRYRFETELDLTGQAGYCSFSLSSGNNYSSRYDVGFPLVLDTATPATPGSTCEYPFIAIPDPPFCQSPCTVDQRYNTTTDTCDPADCFAKYKGSRNIYDETTGLCKPSAVPPPPSSEPITIPTINTPVNGTPTFTMTPEGTYTVDCGENGVYNEQTLTCDCAPGWYTDMQQPIYSFEFCSVQSAFPPDQLYDQNKGPSKGTVNYLKLIVAVTITLVFVIIIALVAGYILSHRKDKNDVEDESELESM